MSPADRDIRHGVTDVMNRWRGARAAAIVPRVRRDDGSERLPRLTAGAVLAISGLLVVVEVWRIADLEPARDVAIAIVASTRVLPAAHAPPALRAPRRAPAGLAVDARGHGRRSSWPRCWLIGPAWSFMLAALATSALIVLPPALVVRVLAAGCARWARRWRTRCIRARSVGERATRSGYLVFSVVFRAVIAVHAGLAGRRDAPSWRASRGAARRARRPSASGTRVEADGPRMRSSDGQWDAASTARAAGPRGARRPGQRRVLVALDRVLTCSHARRSPTCAAIVAEARAVRTCRGRRRRARAQRPALAGADAAPRTGSRGLPVAGRPGRRRSGTAPALGPRRVGRSAAPGGERSRASRVLRAVHRAAAPRRRGRRARRAPARLGRRAAARVGAGAPGPSCSSAMTSGVARPGCSPPTAALVLGDRWAAARGRADGDRRRRRHVVGRAMLDNLLRARPQLRRLEHRSTRSGRSARALDRSALYRVGRAWWAVVSELEAHAATRSPSRPPTAERRRLSSDVHDVLGQSADRDLAQGRPRPAPDRAPTGSGAAARGRRPASLLADRAGRGARRGGPRRRPHGRRSTRRRQAAIGLLRCRRDRGSTRDLALGGLDAETSMLLGYAVREGVDEHPPPRPRAATPGSSPSGRLRSDGACIELGACATTARRGGAHARRSARPACRPARRPASAARGGVADDDDAARRPLPCCGSRSRSRCTA